MGFPVCFTVAKYENDVFPLCETSNYNVVYSRFCLSKIHFHQSVSLKLIKTMLTSVRVVLGLSPV